MDRNLFKKISQQRVKEARFLLSAGHWPGAYYLIGYSVECAIKACVSKQVKRHDFPDKKPGAPQLCCGIGGWALGFANGDHRLQTHFRLRSGIKAVLMETVEL